MRILRVRPILRASRVLQRRLGDAHRLGKAGGAATFVVARRRRVQQEEVQWD
ncbi:MAG TPA: hypothetical protein VNU01_08160 [Egibacteraceae bacterium]|nr:hypothetical protein [Egibacteraceae bacterium]